MAEIFRPTFGGKKPIVQTLERSGVPNPRPNEEIMAAFVSDVKFFTRALNDLVQRGDMFTPYENAREKEVSAAWKPRTRGD